MGLEPLRASENILSKYLSYIETTFSLRDEELQAQFVQGLRKPGRFAKGPFLEATPPFVAGCSIGQLVEEGGLSREFYQLNSPELPVERDLYYHQEEAVRKIVSSQRNVIVSTGTSSGKTECFLIPILNHLFREKENDVLGPGVRALLLYPMNALANDQLKRLRKLLKSYPDITFGSYTGETETEEKHALNRFQTMYPAQMPMENEMLSRVRMRETPPHILLTNYAMLEYLLLRPEDNVFFDGEHAQNWRFIVIDEAHTYSGAKGIEMAMLLRRLKDRIVGNVPGALQCIGTSATLGDKNYKDVANFGAGLFSETFEWEPDDKSLQDVVIGRRKDLATTNSCWGKPEAGLYTDWSRIVMTPPVALEELGSIGAKSGMPDYVLKEASKMGEWSQYLYLALAGDERLLKLQSRLEDGPCVVEELAQDLFPDDPLGNKRLVALVQLAAAARLHEDEQPLLPARYHFFIRAIEGGYVSLLPTKQFFLERQESIEVGELKYPVFEISACRRCNSLYLTGECETRADCVILRQPGKKYSDDRNSLEQYLFMDSDKPVPDNEDEVVAGGEVSSGEEYNLCGRCGAIRQKANVAKPCSCSEESYFNVLKVKTREGNVHKCPACGSTVSVGSLVRRFTLGADAVTSVLGTALYQQLPESEQETKVFQTDEWGSSKNTTEIKSNRRLLVFSDSRQDAAFFATYLQNSYDQILQRRLMVRTLEEHRDKVMANRWQVNDLAEFLKRSLRELRLYPEKSLQVLETEAWKWVLNEFAASDYIGLEGLGLLGFALPHGKLPKVFSQDPWNLDNEAANSMVTNLLDSVRKNLAVEFPDSVSPEDDFFAPRNREYFFSLRSPVKSRIFSWLPSLDGGNNTRLDYLTRVAKAGGSNCPQQEAIELLEGIWNRVLMDEGSPWGEYFSVTQDGVNGPVYRLKPGRWELRPTHIGSEDRWYRCSKCRRLTLHNVKGVCPTYRCEGSLLECKPEEDLAANHYRRLYLETLPLAMRTQEHTAQLTTERAAEVQMEFYGGKINVLSCSTTFELGVDVGELETVLMRNVPPSPANYIQRAGRAGRRTSSAAFVLTFAQRRSHDFSHFASPLGIIKGEIKPPHIELSNEKIIRRHLFAVALALYWRIYPKRFGRANNFFLGQKLATEEMKEFLDARPEQLRLALSRIIPAEMQVQLGLDDWGWVEELLGKKDGVLAMTELELLEDLAQLRQVKAEFRDLNKDYDAAHIQRVINTIEARFILDYLSQHNVIPKYGFPVDVVQLQIHHHKDYAKGLELNRDLRIALSEYAPESQVVAGGRFWTSRYLKKLPDREPVKYDYAICNVCGRYTSKNADLGEDLSVCPCGEKVGRNRGTFITPEFGFIAGPPAKPSMTRPKKTYTTRKYFAQSGSIQKELEINLNGIKMKLQTGIDGKLAVVNSAGGRGFRVCSTCGYAEIYSEKFPRSHRNQWGKECKGQFSRYSLGYEFKTDILQIWFPDYSRGEKGFWESLLYGLLEGACSALDIERQDVDGTLYAHSGNLQSPSLILFDDVPGGAGHVKRIGIKENLVSSLQRTLEIANRCECGGQTGDSSCYSCLRSYSNQYCHDLLRRGFVRDFLKMLLER